MKKLISVLLALLMVFSVVTVAFAADGDAAEEPKENSAFDAIVKALIGDGSIENIPIGTAKAGLKIAKIFLDLVNSIAGMLNNGGQEEAPAEPTSQAPVTPTGEGE